jgi:hypothetical protein
LLITRRAQARARARARTETLETITLECVRFSYNFQKIFHKTHEVLNYTKFHLKLIIIQESLHET